MKTPDAIKKGLWCCYGDSDRRHCEKCPHGAKVEGYTEIMCVGFDRNGEDALALIRQLEEALLLMVYQYCDEGDGTVNHRYMAAGEHAFAALGIENGCSIEQIEKMLDEMERGGEVE